MLKLTTESFKSNLSKHKVITDSLNITSVVWNNDTVNTNILDIDNSNSGILTNLTITNKTLYCGVLNIHLNKIIDSFSNQLLVKVTDMILRTIESYMVNEFITHHLLTQSNTVYPAKIIQFNVLGTEKKYENTEEEGLHLLHITTPINYTNTMNKFIPKD